jgi:hypothetical protein
MKQRFKCTIGPTVETMELKRFFKAINDMKMTVFWNVARCGLVEIDCRFRGACCLHHQGAELAVRSLAITLHFPSGPVFFFFGFFYFIPLYSIFFTPGVL